MVYIITFKLFRVNMFFNSSSNILFNFDPPLPPIYISWFKAWKVCPTDPS